MHDFTRPAVYNQRLWSEQYTRDSQRSIIFIELLRGRTLDDVGEQVGLSGSRVSQIFRQTCRRLQSVESRPVGELARHEFGLFGTVYDILGLKKIGDMRKHADHLIEFYEYLLDYKRPPVLHTAYPDVGYSRSGLFASERIYRPVCVSCNVSFATSNSKDQICYGCLVCARELAALLQSI